MFYEKNFNLILVLKSRRKRSYEEFHLSLFFFINNYLFNFSLLRIKRRNRNELLKSWSTTYPIKHKSEKMNVLSGLKPQAMISLVF